MTKIKNEAGSLLPITVTEGVTVKILTNVQHEFVMSTKEVAHGYGTSDYSVRKALLRHSDELLENKHFVTAGTICPGDHHRVLSLPHNAVLWTKRGIVRLGFFIKSERAKLFRDWAEELVIEKVEQHRQQTLFDVPARQLPARRNHNRLTSDRLLSIMADVARIDDREVRLSIANKLMMGGLQ